MNKSKANRRPGRLVAFMMIATILLCIIAFSAGGWKSMTNAEEGDKGDFLNGINGNNSLLIPQENPTQPITKYYNYLTGAEINEDNLLLKKTAFVISTKTPLFGVSAADIVIEMPTESQENRLLVYTDSINNIGKVGSIAPTRSYISAMLSSFGGLLIANGNDDTIKKDSLNLDGKFMNLSKLGEYSYKEKNDSVYTNSDLIKSGISNEAFSSYESSVPTIPYIISTDEKYAITGDISAQNIYLTFSEGEKSALSYSLEKGCYTLLKNNTALTDALYNTELTYKNIFVLFADSVTYEKENKTELVMNTEGGGRGYYARDGVAEEISWTCDASGKMTFKNSDGAILTVGSGNSYIGFMKSSQIDNFSIK